MNFEDSIRKSFDPDSFEFNEAHWEGAKFLLDKEFARRALYRKVFWLVAINLLIAALLYFGINHYNSKKESLPIFAATNNSIDRDGVSKEYTANAPSLVVPGSIHNEVTGKSERILQDGMSNTKIGQSMKDVNTQAHSSIGSEDIIANTPITENQIVASNLTNQTSKPKFKSTGSTGASVPLLSNEKHEDILSVAQEIVAESIRLQSDNSTQVSPVDFLESNFLSNTTIYSSHQTINSIESSITNISDGSFSMTPREAANFASTEVMLFPSGSSSSFNYVGFSLGLARQVPIGNQFFYEVGLRGAVRLGDFSPSVRSTQLSFDFGTRQNEYQLKPSAVYSLQTPVFVGVDLNKHQLSGGVVPAFLLGVRGTSEYRGGLHPWEINNNPGNTSNTLDRGWLDKSGFNIFALSYAVRYQYKISEGFQLGVSAQYRSGDWVGEDYGKFFDFDTMEYVYSPAEQRNMVQRNWIIALEMRYGF